MLGLGIENQALIKYLLKHKVGCEITICDRRDEKYLGDNLRLLRRLSAPRNDIKMQLGKKYNKNLEKFDILFRAPGWPITNLTPTLSLKRRGSRSGVKAGEVSSPMQFFLELCPTKNIIGVTGTKGKGTTSSLIYEILKKSGKKVWLGGNIGVAPFEFFDKIKTNDWVVLELSSFQLEDMTVSPHIAVITNFYPEHLAPADPNNPNFHKSLKDYWAAKLNIAKYQTKNDYLIYNFQFSSLKQFSIHRLADKSRIKSKVVYFKKSELPSQLVGEHNKENIAAAVEAAKIIGIKNEVIIKTVADFNGLEHRIELVRELKGIKYYDDSFATTPEATITALKSFSSPIIVLLGGAEKKSDFRELAREAAKRIRFAVLLDGKSTLRIKRELLKANIQANKMKLVNNINEAVKLAQSQAAPGDIVLLSTACASFGMFKNYKERGNLFKEAVKKLK